MRSPETDPIDSSFAEFFSFGSKVVSLSKLVQRGIVGNNNVPDGWDVLPEKAADFGVESWMKVKGNPNCTALPIPRFYRLAAQFAIERSSVEAARPRTKPSLDCVALSGGQFGENVVIGKLASGLQFAQAAGSDAILLGATKISRDDLWIMPGVWTAEEFRPVPGHIVSVDEAKFLPRKFPLA